MAPGPWHRDRDRDRRAVTKVRAAAAVAYAAAAPGRHYGVTALKRRLPRRAGAPRPRHSAAPAPRRPAEPERQGAGGSRRIHRRGVGL